jgi:predicted XRE-type DNA-binding protein
MKTRAELLAELHRQVEEAGTQTAWAEAHGVNQGQVSAVLRGAKPLSDGLAEKMGYRAVFVPIRTITRYGRRG